MTIARLRDLKTLEEVAMACGTEGARIQTYADAAIQAAFYQLLRIPKRGPKRNGTHRVVNKALNTALSNFHRSMAMIVVNSAPFGEHVQGFVKKRSTRTNAVHHLGARVLLHADIVDFFDAISTAQVQEAFVTAGTPAALASTLARACTIDGYLRQGTRCAPAIANLVCQNLDADFLSLASNSGATYTRYADNLTFSGDQVPDSASVEHILNTYGFALRDGRCYVQHRGRSQYVTGLTIADTTRPRLPRRLKRQLRLVFHFIEKLGVVHHTKANSVPAAMQMLRNLQGMLSYVNSIEPDLARKGRDALAKGIQKSLHPPSA